MNTQRTLATIVTGLFLIACHGDEPKKRILVTGTHPTTSAPTQQPTVYTTEKIAFAEPEAVQYKDKPSKVLDKKNEQDSQGVLKVYFRTNSDTLLTNDKTDLTTYIKAVPADEWIVEGYADARGSPDANQKLGIKRAEGIRDMYLAGKKVTITSHGESKATCAESDKPCMEGERYARIIPVHITAQVPTTKAAVIDAGMTQIGQTDSYLVDLTSSMQEELSYIQGHDYKGAAVYGFNSCNRMFDVSTKPIQVCGNTPLWDSLESVTKKLDKRSSLTLISDGGNNLGSTSPTAAIHAAKARGITVNVIGVGSYTVQAKNELGLVAKETGGQIYMRH
ncbi:MAG: OmpA family protein [Candidatus Woesearchaeota archaeon]|jgi:outer membrane protein OmpA-like peptidoglycan-associated protein